MRKSHLGTAALLALTAVLASGCFQVSSDVQALRNSVTKSGGAKWEEQLEIGVGSWTLNLARTGLSFVDLDARARALLDAARGADVGVYKIREGENDTRDFPATLAAADKAMMGRGWDRLVTVLDGNDLVIVYVPQELHSTEDVKVCFLALSGRQLVIASARSNLDPLLQLAFHEVAESPVALLDGGN